MAPYGSSHGLTDAAALSELGSRLAQQRLQRNLTQAELATEAGVSKRTLVRFENGESGQLTNLIRVVRALGMLNNLDALIPPPTPSPLALLRSRSRVRRRASPRSQQHGPSIGLASREEAPAATPKH